MPRKQKRVPNFTDEQSRKLHRVAHPRRKPRGRGFFLVSCPPEAEPVFLVSKDIGYDQASKKGQRFLSYKWVENNLWTDHLRDEEGVRLLAAGLESSGCKYCQQPDPRDPRRCINLPKNS